MKFVIPMFIDGLLFVDGLDTAGRSERVLLNSFQEMRQLEIGK